MRDGHRPAGSPAPKLAASTLLAAVAAVLVATDRLSADAGDPLSFAHDVRPILMDSCLACHGPDGEARRGGLRLDDRMAAIEAGAIVPGDAEASEAIRRIFSDDADERMPPPEHHHPLSDADKALIERWIEQGAEYEPHWAFEPIERPAVPELPEATAAWARNAIDHFVASRLEQAGLTPAAEADRRTLARRVALDLTGLPPTPEQVARFVADDSPDAYERYVDRMLSRSAWGEHRARYWLDTARYADTHGLHFDNFREMWSYRDWVIDAFNANMPFDQFTREQLAGDLLPDPQLDQLVATGFHRCNVTTNEGGTIDEETLVMYMRDRVETTATAWLGLTASCAACHDHKYDPVSQKEYYQLAAFFNNTTQDARDGNTPETPPSVTVPLREDRDRWEALPGELAAAEAELASHEPVAREQFAQWLNQRDADDATGEAVPPRKLHVHAPLTQEEDDSLAIEIDGERRVLSVGESADWTEGPLGEPVFSSRSGERVELSEVGQFDHDERFSFGAWVKFGDDQQGAVFARMDSAENDHRGWDLWVEGGRVGMHLIHNWPGDAFKLVTEEPVAKNQWLHLFITYDGSSSAEGVRIYVDGEAQEVNVTRDQLSGTTRSEVPFTLARRYHASQVDGMGLYDLRIYRRTLTPDEVLRLATEAHVGALLAKATDDLDEQQKQTLFRWWRFDHDAAGNALRQQLAELERERDAIEQRGTTAHVMEERDEPATAHVLFRGEYDQRLDEVSPGVPGMLPPMDEDLPANRLGLAEWLLTDEQPLTARVTVNRFWQEVFGRGIVATVDDFGFAGEMPTHPDLLDWLAAEFRESGWDVKKLFRTIVTSATYRQAAVVDDRKLENDPDNAMLSRGPRFRMDGEMVRDYALAASGLLVERIGGPSVKPYQPEGVWEAVAMPGSDTRFYERGTGDDLYRRSVYTFWKRSAPPAFLEIFDATTREVCTVTRDRTNTPLQALATLNDVQLIEAARHTAERALLHAEPSTDARLDHVAEHVLLRPLRSDERTVVRQTLDQLKAFYADHAEKAQKLVTHGESEPDDSLDPPQLAAWTMLANQMLNFDEVLNK